jgi:hypothetical protein
MALVFNNTFLQAETPADLRLTTMIDRYMAFVLGSSASNDGGHMMYMWYDTSLDTDDGVNVLKPTSLTTLQTGRWKRIQGWLNTTTFTPTIGISKSGVGTRAFNTAFQVSATKTAIVMYSIEASPTLSLTGGQTAKVVLSTSATSGGTFTAVSGYKDANTGSLTIGLNMTDTAGGVVSSVIQPGYWVKLDTTGTTSGLTITLIALDETILG